MLISDVVTWRASFGVMPHVAENLEEKKCGRQRVQVNRIG